MVEIVAAWLAIGAVNSGFVYAYFQREYSLTAEENRRVDFATAIIFVAAGPIGVTSAFMTGYFLHHNAAKWYTRGWLFPGSRP